MQNNDGSYKEIDVHNFALQFIGALCTDHFDYLVTNYKITKDGRWISSADPFFQYSKEKFKYE